MPKNERIINESRNDEKLNTTKLNATKLNDKNLDDDKMDEVPPKSKILHINRIIHENATEQNPISLQEIIRKLDGEEIPAERRSVMSDIEKLIDIGIDVIKLNDGSYKYYIGDRGFQFAEVKMLIDAVCCSKFITYKKSKALIDKLLKFVDSDQAKTIEMQLHSKRNKSQNEGILNSVDRLHHAISTNKKVTFKYFKLNFHKEKEYKKEGDLYCVSPYGLSWDDENYYLVTYSSKYADYTHYRVDKMDNIEIQDEQRESIPGQKAFDMSEYTHGLFSMYGGKKASVKLQFDQSLLNVMLDRFGKDIIVNQVNPTTLSSTVRLEVSPTFFGWLFQFGTKMTIQGPENIRQDFKQHLSEVLEGM